MNYYLIENGIITQSADWKFDEKCLETEEEIIRNDKGTLMLKSDYDLYIASEEYKEELAREAENWFKANFFETSLGWIRREPMLANGEKDNFLNNNLSLFAFALSIGETVILPIAYQTPDFTTEITEDYLKGLQLKNQVVTTQFIKDCIGVKRADFTG